MSQKQPSSSSTSSKVPTLDDLIDGQSASGFWKDKSLVMRYVKERETDTESIEKIIKENIKDQSEYLQVYLTILALWILKEKYDEQEDEWQMIAKKAKNYLKEQGFEKVEQLYKIGSLTLN